MDMRGYSAKHFLKLADVADGPIVKTIASIKEGDYGKPDVTFTDGTVLSLNKTAVLELSKAYGFESENWIGRSIEIAEGTVTHKGTEKPAIVVRGLDAKAEA